MKSSAWASDEIKSAFISCRKADFFAKRFHPTQVGFLPPSADLVEKSTCFRKCFFLAPRTGLEPVLSLTVSDSQACTNIAGATRQAHSRLVRSLTHFRYSLLRAFDIKKEPFRLFFLVNYQLRKRRGAFSVGMQMKFNHDVMGKLARKSKNKTHPFGWVLFLAPRTGLEPVTS